MTDLTIQRQIDDRAQALADAWKRQHRDPDEQEIAHLVFQLLSRILDEDIAQAAADAVAETIEDL